MPIIIWKDSLPLKLPYAETSDRKSIPKGDPQRPTPINVLQQLLDGFI
jgi:hypothetical protein